MLEQLAALVAHSLCSSANCQTDRGIVPLLSSPTDHTKEERQLNTPAPLPLSQDEHRPKSVSSAVSMVACGVNMAQQGHGQRHQDKQQQQRCNNMPVQHASVLQATTADIGTTAWLHGEGQEDDAF